MKEIACRKMNKWIKMYYIYFKVLKLIIIKNKYIILLWKQSKIHLIIKDFGNNNFSINENIVKHKILENIDNYNNIYEK